MSYTIEHEIAAMSFDASGFTSGINTSLKDIDRMTEGLRFSGALQGVSSIENKINSLDLTAGANSINGMTVGFSAMGAVGFTVLSRLTNGVIDLGKALLSNLVIAPLKEGFSEFELQINSVQTILSNTRKEGTKLSDVTDALDELNKYADLTIYNFAQMTKNIGTFTAAGINLETSIASIKGIANLGAISGSDANQVNSAMYQMSQALGAGVVKLQDWNSIVNAGMGGAVFKSLLIDVANVTGAIEERMGKNANVTLENFRGTLEEGWLTSDVLLKSLQAISGELSVIDLMEMGFSEEKANEIFAIGQDAVEAATKVKTFTQLIDVAREAMQSGWAQTWKIIVGDFEESKSLFTGLSQLFGGAISEAAEARNKFWSVWVIRGGREVAIQGIYDAFEAILNTVNNFKSAVGDVFTPFKGWNLYNITKLIGDWIGKIKMASESGTRFKSIIRGIASFFDIVKMAISAVLKPLFGFSDSLFSGVDGFIDLLATAGNWLFLIRNILKNTDFFNKSMAILIEYFKLGVYIIKQWFYELSKTEVIQDLIFLLSNINGETFVKVFEWIKNVLYGVGYAIGAVIYGLKLLYDGFMSLTPVKKALEFIQETFTYDNLKLFLNEMISKIPLVKEKFNELKIILENVWERVVAFFDGFNATEAWESFLKYINSFDGSSIESFFTTVFSWTDKIPSLTELLNIFKSDPNKKPIDFRAWGRSFGEAIKGVFDYLGSTDINFTGLANVLGAGFLGSIALSLRTLVKGSWVENIWNVLFGGEALASVSESISGAFGAIEGAVVSWQNNMKADTLQKIAISLGIVAASALALSLIDQTKLAGAVGAMTALMAALFGGVAVLSKLSLTNVGAAATAVLLISGSLLVLSIAMKIFSSMDTNELQKGLIVIGIALAGFIAAVKLLSYGGIERGIIRASLALGVLSASLMVMALAIKILGSLPVDVATNGLLLMGTAITIFLAFVKLINGAEAILAAVSIAILAGSVILLAYALKDMGSLSLEEIAKSMVALGGAMLILIASVKLMTGSLTGAAAMIVVSGAVLILAYALKILGNLSWEAILKSLVALAGVFLVLGLAGVILGPIIPVLIGLGAAMLLVGLGALALGAGISLAAVGLTLLAGSAVGIAVAIGILAGAVALALPIIATAIATAIVNFFTALANAATPLLEAAKTLILTLVTAIVEVTPQIISGLLTLIDELLTQLADKVPDFIQSGLTILLGFLQGIEDNIGLVTEKAVGIITKFIQGLTDSVPQLIEAGFGLINAITGAIAQGITDQGQTLLDNGWSIASSIITGLINGINAGLNSIVSAATSLGQSALDAFNDVFDIHSPAKEPYKIAQFVGKGLYLGLMDSKSQVVGAAFSMASEIQNGIENILNSIQTSLDYSGDLHPKVVPVLDDSRFRKGFSSMSSNLSQRVGVVNTAIEKERNSIFESMDEASKNGKGAVTFIQQNYSPKALTTTELYRQTESQIERIRRYREESR